MGCLQQRGMGQRGRLSWM